MSSLKLKTPSGGSVSFNAEDTGSDYTLTVPAGNSTIVTTDNPPASLSTASGSAPSYSARAWVNFNGTGQGSIAIRANGNVSSITDNGTGDYTVNFTTAMPDANYAVSGSIGKSAASSSESGGFFLSVKTASTLRFELLYFSGSAFDPTAYDSDLVDVAVFR